LFFLRCDAAATRQDGGRSEGRHSGGGELFRNASGQFNSSNPNPGVDRTIDLVDRASEERGQAPQTEPVPVLPQSVCCSREILEGLATGWPIGQPVASRLANPMSFNQRSLGICGQDWPGWPRISRSDPVCRGRYVEASPANWRDMRKRHLIGARVSQRVC